MEVQASAVEDGGVLASGGGSSVSVSLHPLVVMNISDHHTRVKVQGGDSAARGDRHYRAPRDNVTCTSILLQSTERCWAGRRVGVWRCVTRLSWW